MTSFVKDFIQKIQDNALTKHMRYNCCWYCLLFAFPEGNSGNRYIQFNRELYSLSKDKYWNHQRELIFSDIDRKSTYVRVLFGNYRMKAWSNGVLHQRQDSFIFIEADNP